MEKIDNVSTELSKLPLEELMKRLGVSTDGLNQTETQKRLGIYGYNELPEKKESMLLKFLSYFWGPIPIMIMIAAVVGQMLN